MFFVVHCVFYRLQIVFVILVFIMIVG